MRESNTAGIRRRRTRHPTSSRLQLCNERLVVFVSSHIQCRDLANSGPESPYSAIALATCCTKGRARTIVEHRHRPTIRASSVFCWELNHNTQTSHPSRGQSTTAILTSSFCWRTRSSGDKSGAALKNIGFWRGSLRTDHGDNQGGRSPTRVNCRGNPSTEE